METSIVKKIVLFICALAIAGFAFFLSNSRSKAAPDNYDGQVTQNDCLGMDGTLQNGVCTVHAASFSLLK